VFLESQLLTTKTLGIIYIKLIGEGSVAVIHAEKPQTSSAGSQI